MRAAGKNARPAADAPLVRHRLLHIIADPNQPQSPLLAHYLKVDDAVVRALLGQLSRDARLTPFCQLNEPDAKADALAVPENTRKALDTLAAKAGESRAPLRLYFQGPAGAGQKRASELIAARLSLKLLTADLPRALAVGSDFDAGMALLLREATLLKGVLYLENLDALRGDDRAPVCDHCPTLPRTRAATADNSSAMVLAPAASGAESFRIPVEQFADTAFSALPRVWIWMRRVHANRHRGFPASGLESRGDYGRPM